MSGSTVERRPAAPMQSSSSRHSPAARYRGRRAGAAHAACACVTLLCAGCQKKTEATPAPVASAESASFVGTAPRLHPAGELAQARDYSMSVESVKECPMEPPFSPRRGATKLGIEVVVEGTTMREVPVNPFYATVTDGAGQSYAATLAGCEPGLPSVRVVRGQKARGFVTFELPKTTGKLELRYAPLVIGAGSEELLFTVER